MKLKGTGSFRPSVSGIPPEQAESHALHHLMQQHQVALVSFIRRHLPPGEEVEDMLQELYAHVMQRSDIIHMDYPQAFLFKAAHNLLRDKSRKAAVRQRGDHMPLKEEALVSEQPSQEQALVAKQDFQAFQEMLAAMPPKCRKVFILHRVEGMKYQEIAAHFCISVSAVEKSMMRAMAFIDKYRMTENA